MAQHQVVIRSVGTASPSLPAALAQALPLAPERLARCVYQAPAVLLGGLPELQAHSIAELLKQTGLEVDVTSADESVLPGGPELELAVHVADMTRFREVAAALAQFLGCNTARAVSLLCASPPVVLGQVSSATAQALETRMSPLGAEVDVSRTAEARYDVFVDANEATLRVQICRILREAGITPEAEGPLLALGVPREIAQRLWSRVGNGAKWRMVDQAFQRFDIVVEQVPDSAEASAALIAATQMPASVIPKLRERLPLLLCEALPNREVGPLLNALAKAGVVASAQLVTFSSWDVVVTEVRDPAATAEVLSQIVDRKDEPSNEEQRAARNLALRRLPARLALGIGLARARWLVHELRAVGALAELEAR